jgi:putative acetyltransferase
MAPRASPFHRGDPVVTAPFAIRPEAEGDEAAIRTIHESAFGGPLEAALADALRRSGDLVLSLVAAAESPVGHVAFPRLAPDDGGYRAVALAPLAIRPEWHGRGVGTALVREALDRLTGSGEDLVLVRGDPAFYGRFGFSAERTRPFRTPFDGRGMQALALTPRGREAAGTIRYPPAFDVFL